MNVETQLLRIKDVSKKTTLAKSTIWLKIAKGEFPKCKKISPSICVWLESDINGWIQNHFSENPIEKQ